MTNGRDHSSLASAVPHARGSHPVRLGDLAIVAAVICGPTAAFAQTAFTWPEIRARFEAANPTLLADQIGVDESRATEITAYLRPNPQMSVTFDQIGHNDEGRP